MFFPIFKTKIPKNRKNPYWQSQKLRLPIFLPILGKKIIMLGLIIRGCRIKVKMHKEQLSQIFNKKPSPAGSGATFGY